MQLHTECSNENETSGPFVVALEGFGRSSDKVRHVQSYDSDGHVLLQTGVRVTRSDMYSRTTAMAEKSAGAREGVRESVC